MSKRRKTSKAHEDVVRYRIPDPLAMMIVIGSGRSNGKALSHEERRVAAVLLAQMLSNRGEPCTGRDVFDLCVKMYGPADDPAAWPEP